VTPAGRRKVNVTPFRIADLALAEIPEAMPQSAAPSELPDGLGTPELVLEEEKAPGAPWASGLLFPRKTPGMAAKTSISMRAHLRNHAFGWIWLGAWQGVSGSETDDVPVTCGGPSWEGSVHVTPARWVFLETGAGGGVHYTVVNAWFDFRSCRAAVVARVTVELTPIAGGALYAFRRQCACDSGEALTVLGPPATGGTETTTAGDQWNVGAGFLHIILPIQRGGGGSAVAHLAPGSLAAWVKATGHSLPADQDLVAGVEIAQAVGDPEPVAVAYVSATEPL
jgi:hypothetical protein